MATPGRLYSIAATLLLLACGGSTGLGDDFGGTAPESGGSTGAGRGGGGSTAAGAPALGGTAPGVGGVAWGGRNAAGAGAIAGQCSAPPLCQKGDVQIKSAHDCPPGSSCYEVLGCGYVIACASPNVQCTALPVCDVGDQQLMERCPPVQGCYQRSLCGSTVWCRDAGSGAGGSTGSAGAPAGGATSVCDPGTEPYRHYVSTIPRQCELLDFVCDAGTIHFWNECGCGCEKTAGICNPAAEPDRRYVLASPRECQLIDFECDAGSSHFTNDCGCGCEQPESCPDSVDCRLSSRFSMLCASGRDTCPFTVRIE